MRAHVLCAAHSPAAADAYLAACGMLDWKARFPQRFKALTESPHPLRCRAQYPMNICPARQIVFCAVGLLLNLLDVVLWAWHSEHGAVGPDHCTCISDVYGSW